MHSRRRHKKDLEEQSENFTEMIKYRDQDIYSYLECPVRKVIMRTAITPLR